MGVWTISTSALICEEDESQACGGMVGGAGRARRNEAGKRRTE